MDIYLIRHGQSTGNNTGRFIGWSDHPLTDRGRAQAAAVAARLAPLGPMPVVCSDLLRARHTAETVTRAWGGVPEADTRWREISCGQFEDCPWDDFSSTPGLREAFDLDPYGAALPGGESIAMVSARVTDALAEVLRRGDERVAIVSHCGPICAVLAYCLKIPPERFWSCSVEHGSLTCVTVTDDFIAIRTLNDTHHLAALELVTEQEYQP